ncbi:hypothetical protein K435DRAFT_803299 [Dendrothele bispora CBS 962.96]|uniref:Uncharacterized protein n=1 Tax=Dendrothele bispora (strain CBS 962.96) TaxID=1314807 RepID=A0A4S8LJC4_DENBC|nr:hypothetical protein K435DRAFT_803299 [Dendrothele bispora CBS 962.96]
MHIFGDPCPSFDFLRFIEITLDMQSHDELCASLVIERMEKNSKKKDAPAYYCIGCDARSTNNARARCLPHARACKKLERSFPKEYQEAVDASVAQSGENTATGKTAAPALRTKKRKIENDTSPTQFVEHLKTEDMPGCGLLCNPAEHSRVNFRLRKLRRPCGPRSKDLYRMISDDTRNKGYLLKKILYELSRTTMDRTPVDELPVQDPAATPSSESRPRFFQSTLDSHCVESGNISAQRQAKIDYHLLRFFLCCAIAFAVCKSGFFIDFIVPGYSVPDPTSFFPGHISNEAANVAENF